MKKITIKLLVIALNTFCYSAFSQVASGINSESIIFTEGFQEGVIIIALSSSNINQFDYDESRNFSNKSLFRGLKRELPDNYSPQEENYYLKDKDLNKELLKIQLDIALSASNINPVILLVNTQEDVNNIHSYCERIYGLCSKLEEGKIKVIVIEHDASWIRDYGPQFKIQNGRLTVMDAGYHDSRFDDLKDEKVSIIDNKILKLANTLQTYYYDYNLYYEAYIEILSSRNKKSTSSNKMDFNIVNDKELVHYNDLLSHYKEYISIIEGQLNAYKLLSEVLTKKHVERELDDRAPSLIASSIFDLTTFSIIKPKINLDGGNILRSSNCDCFLTSDILPKNNFDEKNLKEILQRDYLCKRIILLESLPSTINHVDMFLMPIKGNHVLLSSFDLNNELLKKDWVTDYFIDKKLVKEAELVMKKNHETLLKYGFKVTLVPAPFPRYDQNSNIFYPTLLNGLVQKGKISNSENIQILLPSYEGIQISVQEDAFNIIEKAYKKEFNDTLIQLITIECTEAAKLQGAIHCLSITVPLEYVKYFDEKYLMSKKAFENLANRTEILNKEWSQNK